MLWVNLVNTFQKKINLVINFKKGFKNKKRLKTAKIRVKYIALKKLEKF